MQSIRELLHKKRIDHSLKVAQRAEELAQLWNVLCGVLDQFVEMLGGTELDAEEFARLMRLVLTQ